MINKKFYPPSRLVSSSSVVTLNNSEPIKDSTSVYIIESSCLILVQCVNRCEIELGDNLLFNTYIINKIKYDICNVCLKDIIPNGSSFVSSHVQCGDYEYYRGRILYHIDIIRALSYSNISLVLHPETWGKMTNTIEVTSKEHSKYTINNPSEAYSIVFDK